MIDWNGLGTPLLVAAGAAIIVGLAGGLLTDIGPWYRALKFPSWKPPDWAFGPIWTTIFTLAAISAALAWRAGTPDQKTMVVVLFIVNAVLNMAWSGLFFYLRRPDFALIEVAFLWLSIAALIVYLWPISTAASLMLVPYIAWVSAASALNLAVVRLNS